jgi:hypothetical protein
MSALLALLLCVPAGGPPTAPAPRAKPAGGAFKPFDLTYMPRTGNSVVAVRPGELLRHFGEQDKFITDYARRMLAAGFAFIDGDLKAAAPPAVADVEQLIVSARVTLGVETEKDGRSNFGVNGVSSGLIRTARSYDWAGSVKKWFPKAETVEHANREYLRVPIGLGKDTSHLALFVADDRTLAFDTDEDEIRGLLGRLDERLAPAAPPGWDEVCRDLVALAHDTTAAGWLTAPDEPKRETDQALVTVARKTTGVAVGFSAGECTSLRVVAAARDECDALDVRAAVTALVGELAGETEGGLAKLFAASAVSRKGKVVRVRGEVEGNLLRRLLDPDAER